MKDMILYIPPHIHAEIMFHVHKSDVEISGLGRVTRTSAGNLQVTKVYLLEQENSATTTDICPDALAKLQYESRGDEGDLNFWWHSHVNMACNWSGTDTDTFEEFGKQGMLVGTVFNKKGDFRSAIYQGGNEFFPMVWRDAIPTSFMYLPTAKEAEAWDAEHKAKCKKKVYKQHKHSTYLASNWVKDPITGKWEDKPKQHKPKVLKQAKSFFEIEESVEEYDDSKTSTFSGEFLEDVILECEEHLEKGFVWEAIHNFDQFYWWDMYEHFFGKEPDSDEDVEKMYNDCLAKPEIFSIMIYQKEQEALAEGVTA